MNYQEKLACLRLIRSENVGPITWRQLVTRFGSASVALQNIPHLAARGGRRTLRLCSLSEAEAELESLHRLGAELLCWGDNDYPPLLANTDDAPPTLSVLGHKSLLQRPSLGIVGARNASTNGRVLAERIATKLAGQGLIIVSGLARGIDAAAHRGALRGHLPLAAGIGTDQPSPQLGGTIAVLAGGVNFIYPPEHEALYHAIVKEGAVIAELPPSTEPQARHFPRRNRIISGLSLGVLVVEAAVGSGSLITARFAADQGREVLAIPGSPLDARARGGNDLIRQGATLVENSDDILRALQDAKLINFDHDGTCHFYKEKSAQDRNQGFNFDVAPDPLAGQNKANQATTLPSHLPSHPPEREDLSEKERNKIYARITDLLTTSPTALDWLVRDSGYSVAIVNSTLLELELAGVIMRHHGNRVSLVGVAED